MVKTYLCAFSFNFYSVVLPLFSPHSLFLFFRLRIIYFFLANDTLRCTGRNNVDLIKHKCSDKIRLLLFSILYALCKEQRATHRVEVKSNMNGGALSCAPKWKTSLANSTL